MRSQRAACWCGHRAFHLILQPAALLLLPALFKSLLLVATNSRQLTNSMSAFTSGGILSEYEFRSWHSTSQLSDPCTVPSNNVRMTRSHFSLLSCNRCVKAAFRSSSLSPRSISLGSFRAVACNEARAHNGIANSRRLIGAVSLENVRGHGPLLHNTQRDAYETPLCSGHVDTFNWSSFRYRNYSPQAVHSS